MTGIAKILKKKKAILISSGTVFLIILFLYLPLMGRSAGKNKELSGLNAQLELVNDNLRIVRELKVNKRLIKEDEAYLAIDAISKQREINSLELKSINQKEKIIKDGYSILPVYLEVEGEFKELGSFLGFLREFEGALITVDDLQVRRVDPVSSRIAGLIMFGIYLKNG